MKKQILLIFLTLTWAIAATSASYSQTSDSRTAPAQSEAVVGPGQTVPFLIRENKNLRQVKEAQENRINDLEAENTVERENSASVSKSYEAAKAENASLKSANESLHQADNLNKQTIALLQTDNLKQKEKAKKATKAKWKAYGVAAVTIALSYLLR